MTTSSIKDINREDKLFDSLKSNLKKNFYIKHTFLKEGGIEFVFSIKGVCPQYQHTHFAMNPIPLKIGDNDPMTYYAVNDRFMVDRDILRLFNNFCDFYKKNISLNDFEVNRLWSFVIEVFNTYIKIILEQRSKSKTVKVFYETIPDYTTLIEKNKEQVKSVINESRMGVDFGYYSDWVGQFVIIE